MRDSASWDTLDKAIDRLGGTSAVHATVAMEGQAAAAAAAAADALSPGESDEEESTGEQRDSLTRRAHLLAAAQDRNAEMHTG